MVYLDHNATTPLDERVLDAMLPYMREGFGNPSSIYSLGRQARSAIEDAREQIAALVNAHLSQIVFTSGGTESNNFAIKGCIAGQRIDHLYYSAIEHSSVRDVARSFQHVLKTVQPIPIGADAELTVDVLNQTMSAGSKMVSVMWANNETGTIFPIEHLAACAKEKGAVFHSDAVQAVGKVPVDFAKSGVDLLSLSAHKLYGPKGIGALVINKALDMQPLLHGGGQEKGRRSGTENVAAIVGFGKAAEIANEQLSDRRQHLDELRVYLESRLEPMPNVVIFAKEQQRLPNTCFFSVLGIDGESLLMQLDNMGIAVASGSACAEKTGQPSHVLLAMGIDKVTAGSAIRVSFGKDNTVEEVDYFLNQLEKIIELTKSMSVIVNA